MEERTKGYWATWRIAAAAVWLLSLLTLPYGVEWMGWVPDGTYIIAGSLLAVAGLAIFLERIAFRVGIALVILFALGTLFKPRMIHDIVEGLDYRLRDSFFLVRGPEKPTGQVLIVDIDQKSLEEVGQWPWPRTLIARAIRNAKADGARVIGFDIVFAEPDRFSMGEWISRLEAMGIDVALPQEGEEPFVTSDMVRHIVLSDWERTLQEAGWHSDVAGETKAQTVINEFIRFQEQQWNDKQELLAKRSQLAGVQYDTRPYPVPTDPLQEMTKASRELFYIRNATEPDLLLQKGAPIVADNDQALAEAVNDTLAVMGGLLITPSSAGARMEQYTAGTARQESHGLVVSTVFPNADEVFPFLRRAIDQVPNVAVIQDYAYHQGMFNIVPDRSGTARFYTMLMKAPVYQETLVLKPEKANVQGEELFNPDNYESQIVAQDFVYPSIVLEMLRAANGYDVVEPTIIDGQAGLLLKREKGLVYEESELQPEYTKEAFSGLLGDTFFIPLDHKADIQVNFRGDGGRWYPEKARGSDYYFSYVSLSDLLYKRFEPGTFKDKYVILGSTDATLSDLVGSPFRPAFPGLEVHATMLDNLIAGDLIIDVGHEGAVWTYAGILVVGVLLSAAVAYGSAWMSGLITLLILAGVPAMSYFAFAEWGMTFGFVYPWLCGAVLLSTLVLINYFVEGRERRFVVNQFSTMVSSEVLEKVREDPEGIQLKGQRADVSVMFSDLANFTNISEALPPDQLVSLLNDYLTPMADIIMDSHGFIDKYIGDAIMACWGVPFPDGEHAKAACLSCLEQQERLRDIATELEPHYNVKLNARMGISSGEVSAAMMGSANRKNYTVMGDVVNLGARLEPACKDYGINVMICGKTYEAAKDVIEARCVDKLVVKGKSVPVPVYELMGRKGELSDQELEKIDLFEQALRLHWTRNWEEAKSKLRDIQVFDPEDGPTLTLLKRIEEYELSPPPASWQGERVKTNK